MILLGLIWLSGFGSDPASVTISDCEILDPVFSLAAIDMFREELLHGLALVCERDRLNDQAVQVHDMTGMIVKSIQEIG